MFKPADRIQKLPPYLFAEINKMKAKLSAEGVDVIDVGIGDPDMPTPSHIIEALCKAAHNPKYHCYPPYAGTKEFLEASATWMKKTFGVSLNPETETLALIGSKEGIAHGVMAFVNPGDIVLVPSPGYPVYSSSTLFAGGEAYFMPLKKENSFLPDLKAIPKDILKRAKVMFLNYPNNPTGACATSEFFKEAVALAHEHDFIICHDAAYIAINLEGKRALSILETPGAMDVAIEYHSLSKTYNMTGWRVGFACGNKTIVDTLGKFKTHIDSSLFGAVQEAGAVALTSDQSCVEETRQLMRRRRDIVIAALKKAGIETCVPQATFYVWASVPKGFNSASFTVHVMEKTGVVVTPGTGFGEYGEGYFRISLTCPDERLKEAMNRIETKL